MTHAYHQPISVTLTDGAPATPATICWRNIAYRVLEVFETWHLMDRWWERERERPPHSAVWIDPKARFLVGWTP